MESVLPHLIRNSDTMKDNPRIDSMKDIYGNNDEGDMEDMDECGANENYESRGLPLFSHAS